MTKAIIFDCFGVLATEAWLPFKAKYFGHDPKLYEEVSGLAQQSDKGLISYQDFINYIAKLTGLTPDEVRAAVAGNVPNEALFTYIRELKSDYKIGFFSNIAGNYLGKIFMPDQLALFDAMFLSYEHGYVKPQPQAFESIAEKLGVAIEECVLIDDQERNVTGAHNVGMAGILYLDMEQFRRELEQLLHGN